jgi:hypothetical protein
MLRTLVSRWVDRTTSGLVVVEVEKISAELGDIEFYFLGVFLIQLGKLLEYFLLVFPSIES